jgi:hypothetical protein
LKKGSNVENSGDFGIERSFGAAPKMPKSEYQARISINQRKQPLKRDTLKLRLPDVARRWSFNFTCTADLTKNCIFLAAVARNFDMVVEGEVVPAVHKVIDIILQMILVR